MLDSIAKTLVDGMGLSGVMVIGLAAALYRLSGAYIAARDRTEAILKEHEAATRRMTKELVTALHASASAIDGLRETILAELGGEVQ